MKCINCNAEIIAESNESIKYIWYLCNCRFLFLDIGIFAWSVKVVLNKQNLTPHYHQILIDDYLIISRHYNAETTTSVKDLTGTSIQKFNTDNELIPNSLIKIKNPISLLNLDKNQIYKLIIKMNKVQILK